nr:hypothetical protein MFLOJ_27990 [Mycobacterium florentinum]
MIIRRGIGKSSVESADAVVGKVTAAIPIARKTAPARTHELSRDIEITVALRKACGRALVIF